jgi:hypothetical protein
MASALNVVMDWISISPEKQNFYRDNKELVLRWINEAQLRFVNKSEILCDVWSPEIDSTGSIDLPTDFLKAFKDRVKLGSYPLKELNYHDAIYQDFSGVMAYSVYDGKFYVWNAGACSPTIPYLKKPVVITDLLTEELEIPTECHNNLIDYLDALWARKKEDYQGHLLLRTGFDNSALEAGARSRQRLNPTPIMESSRF